MKILKVTVTHSSVEVKYERKTGFCRKKYDVAPDKVLEFMFNANYKSYTGVDNCEREKYYVLTKES